MFDAVKKEEDGGFHFFDTSQFNGHISLSRVFTSSLNKSRAHHYLQVSFLIVFLNLSIEIGVLFEIIK